VIDPLFPMALLTGLLGTGHCLGMCGGLVAALGLAGEGRPRGPLFHLCYNLGRILTYGAIGLAVGWLGSAIAYTDAFSRLSRLVLVASDLVVIVLGLGTAGFFGGLTLLQLEFGGVLLGLTRAATRHDRRAKHQPVSGGTGHVGVRNRNVAGAAAVRQRRPLAGTTAAAGHDADGGTGGGADGALQLLSPWPVAGLVVGGSRRREPIYSACRG